MTTTTPTWPDWLRCDPPSARELSARLRDLGPSRSPAEKRLYRAVNAQIKAVWKKERERDGATWQLAAIITNEISQHAAVVAALLDAISVYREEDHQQTT